MSKLLWSRMLVALLIGLSLTLVLSSPVVQAEEPAPSRLITGRVYDAQGQPVQGVQAAATEHGQGEPIAQSATQADGRYALSIPDNIPDRLIVQLERTHFGFSVSPNCG